MRYSLHSWCNHNVTLKLKWGYSYSIWGLCSPEIKPFRCFCFKSSQIRSVWPQETVKVGAVTKGPTVSQDEGRLLIANQQFIWQFNCHSAITSHSCGVPSTLKQLLIPVYISCHSVLWFPYLRDTHTSSSSILHKAFIFSIHIMQTQADFVYYRHYILCPGVLSIHSWGNLHLEIQSKLRNHFRSNSTNAERHIYMVIVCDSVSSRSSQIMCFVFMKSAHPGGSIF